jgi:PleD family two-component response regulator
LALSFSVTLVEVREMHRLLTVARPTKLLKRVKKLRDIAKIDITQSVLSPQCHQRTGMRIKVFLADGSDMLRAAMRQILAKEPSIEIVGEARSFPEAIQMVADIKPAVLLYDLYLSEERNFAPDFVRELLRTVPHTLAVSLSNDTETKAIAASYGAQGLLDKRNLSGNMIPAIMNCCAPRAERTASTRLP